MTSPPTDDGRPTSGRKREKRPEPAPSTEERIARMDPQRARRMARHTVLRTIRELKRKL